MGKLKKYILGLIGIAVGATLIYFGEFNPPNSIYLFGLFIGSISIFYIIIVGVLQFAIYLLKELGYADR